MWRILLLGMAVKEDDPAAFRTFIDSLLPNLLPYK